MAREKEDNKVLKTLQDIHITILLAHGARQLEVQKIVGVDIKRVNKIAKQLKK